VRRIERKGAVVECPQRNEPVDFSRSSISGAKTVV
jgi:hypothetical protein